MTTTMKRMLTLAVLALLAIAAWHAVDGGDWQVDIDGDQYDGPLGTAIGMLFAGGGLVIAAVAIVCAAVFVGVLFAGLGILMVVGLGLLAVVLAAIIAPFLLPLLIPLGIFWLFARRARRQRARQQAY